MAKAADGSRVAVWQGDAGYDEWNADAPGHRHRLIMAKTGFVFDNTIAAY